MCTVVVLYRPEHDWPLILAANRDEMIGRPWRPPARHWADRPEVVAGQDLLAGGTWLGLNDHGVVAGILNRRNSLGPMAGMRSRGELPLEALDHAEARAAVAALENVEGRSYRSFNMVVADRRDAFWLRWSGAGNGSGPGRVEAMALPPGLSMITAYDRNDDTSPRMRLYMPRFQAAPPPEPEKSDWSAWQALLASREHDPGRGPHGAMTIVTDSGFGTVSSSLLALPNPRRQGAKAVWLFAAGRPDGNPYRPITL
jgi:hypothetical protein